MNARSLLLVLPLLLGASASFAADRQDAPTDPFGTAWKAEYAPPDDAWKSVPQDLIFNNGADPETIDPAVMTGVTEHTLALALYEGLVTHDPATLEARPGVAERWETSDDLLTYTFHLRKDAKWSNGEPVTAADFAWSWYRCGRGDPELQCDYVYLFDYIEGYEAWRREAPAHLKATGKFQPYDGFLERVGVKVVDPLTLVVKLRAPTAYFLDLCAFETYMPVHRATVEKYGKDWVREAHWVGNGPFVLAESKPRLHIRMTPNPHYWDRDFVKLTSITALPLDDQDVVYNKFLQGEVHWIRSVPTAKLEEAKRNPDYFVQPYLGSYFYRFNVTSPHLKDKRVRKALSMAVDRESITRDVTRAGQIPAAYFCPPVAGYEPPKGFPYDPDAARALLAEAGYPGGKDFPRLTIFYNTNEDHKKVAERIGQMWREVLGIDIALQNAEWKVYLSEVENLDYEVARAGWIGDYGDPMTFMDMWQTGGGNNNTGWSNKRYDELLHEVQLESDHRKRLAIFREMEEIIVEDEFPILPLYIYVNQGMKVYGLAGWYGNVRDLHPFQYMYFEPDE